MTRTKQVAPAVEMVRPQISEAIDQIVERLEDGGKLLLRWNGHKRPAWRSRASEIRHLWVSYELVQGIIAGGYDALYKATESSEDNAKPPRRSECRGISPADAVVGIAASGRTPYTIGAVEYARSLGCFTAAIVCTPESH